MTDTTPTPDPTPDDRTEVYQDKPGEWRWRRVAANNEIIATAGESYTRKHDAERAARRVFGLPQDAPMVRRVAYAAGRTVRDFLGRPVWKKGAGEGDGK